jgi:hypothetical protein
MGGDFCLCALTAPEADFDRIADLVNAHPEVAHNYARDHELNMWFVLATPTPEGIAEDRRPDRGRDRADRLAIPQASGILHRLPGAGMSA